MKRILLGLFAGIVAGAGFSAHAQTTPLAGLPPGYQQLEWIVAHGEESIDTGVCPSGTTSLAMKVRPAVTNLLVRLFVSRYSNYAETTGSLSFEGYINTGGRYAGSLGDDAPGGIPSSLPVSEERDATIELKAPTAELIVNGVSKSLGTPTCSQVGQTNILLFAKAEWYGFHGRLYSATVKEGDTVVRAFVPCRRLSDGAVGLYDTAVHATEPANGRFYGNTGSGGCLDGGPIVRTPLTVTYDASTQQATVTFAAAAEARTLSLVYDECDYGPDITAWPQARYASVPAGATSVTVDMTEPMVPARVLRAFLPFANGEGFYYGPTAADYVQNGLYAQWDGYENAGAGLPHDSTLDAPVELKGKVGDVVLSGTLPACGERAFAFGSGTLTFCSTHLMEKLNAGEMTAEIVLAENGDLAHNGGLLAFGSTTRAFWAYSQKNASNNGMVNAVSYHGTYSGQFTNIKLSPQGTPGTNTYAFALGPGDNANNGSCLTNGVLAATFKRYSTDCTTNDFWLGILPISNGVKGNAKVFSIRLYDRLLTTEDMQANAAIDRQRFTTVSVDEASEACFVAQPFTATLRADETGVTADVSFTASAADRALYVAWGRDAGDRLSDWTNAAFVCAIPAKTNHLSSVALPAAVTQKSRGVRFFLLEADAKSYVQDGLFAQWDGIENDAYGTRDATLSAPKVLGNAALTVTANGTLPVDAADPRAFDFGSGDLTFVSDAYLQKVNAGEATLEIVLAKNGTYVNNGGIFQFGNDTRVFWAYQQSTAYGMVRAYSYHAAISGQFANMDWAPTDETLPSTLAFQLGPETDRSAVFSDGAVFSETLTRYAIDCTDVGLGSYLGVLKYPSGGTIKSVRPRAKVYSIRLYNRRLTADEIAANAAVDAVRFQSAYPAATAYLRMPVGCYIIVR